MHAFDFSTIFASLPVAEHLEAYGEIVNTRRYKLLFSKNKYLDLTVFQTYNTGVLTFKVTTLPGTMPTRKYYDSLPGLAFKHNLIACSVKQLLNYLEAPTFNNFKAFQDMILVLVATTSAYTSAASYASEAVLTTSNFYLGNMRLLGSIGSQYITNLPFILPRNHLLSNISPLARLYSDIEAYHIGNFLAHYGHGGNRTLVEIFRNVGFQIARDFNVHQNLSPEISPVLPRAGSGLINTQYVQLEARGVAWR